VIGPADPVSLPPSRPAVGLRGVRRLRGLRGRKTWGCAAAAAVLGAAAQVAFGTRAAAFVLGSTALVWAAVPLVASLARRLRVVAHPGGRGVHRRSTPLMGGAALFVPVVLAACAWAYDGDGRAVGLLGAATLMLAVGILDDARGLRARTRLLAQVGAAGLLVLSGFRLPALDVPPFGAIPLGSLEVPVLVLWVVGVTNAFNLIDGIDGLAGGLVLVAAVLGAAGGASPVLAAALAGASIGFLRHNLPRARVFLGDTGSLLLGLTVAALTLDLPAANNVACALGAVSYAVGDVTLCVLRRLLRAKPLLTADRSHVHHKVLFALRSPMLAVAVLFAFAATQAAVPLLASGVAALVAMAFVWAALVVFVVRRCRVGIRRMFAHRRDFRRIHATRTYVLALVGAARVPAEVYRAVQLVPQGLDLTAVEFHDVLWRRPAPPGDPVRRIDVPLGASLASWEGAPRTDDPALDTEIESVTNELLRAADRRLDALRAAAGPETTRPAGASARAAASGRGAGHLVATGGAHAVPPH
jgi:UDP-GlcNAc:undecaprenyl-phosphate GlcNAc-1-phosphate transferase